MWTARPGQSSVWVGLDNDIVVTVGRAGGVHAFAAADGRSLWTKSLGRSVSVTPTVISGPTSQDPHLRGHAIVIADASAGLTALSTSTGATRWHRVLPRPVAEDITSIGARVVAIDATGTVHLMRLSDGIDVATYSEGRKAITPADITDGHYYIVFASGQMVGLPYCGKAQC